jgi:hypothetical protein
LIFGPTTIIFLVGLFFSGIIYLLVHVNVDYSKRIIDNVDEVMQGFLKNPMGIS